MSSSPQHDVLLDSQGQRLCMLGNHAIVRGALEAGVQFFSCYPGTPSSEIGDTFAQIHEAVDVLFEYSVNEKIAVEVAFAASLSGARAMCSMKHLGLNYAGDPVSTMPYVGVDGGMVIVSAGDPSSLTSPNEQDQRHLTKFLYYPIFDPATPQDALEMTVFAFELSEKTRLPVIMRPTTRVCHASSIVEIGSLAQSKNEIAFEKNPAQHVPMPANSRRMRTELTARYQLAEDLLRESPFFPRSGSGKSGVIASGVAYTYASQVISEHGLEDRVSVLKIGAYPIPDAVIVEFLRSVETVLVVEELTPLVEEWVSLAAFRAGIAIEIRGKNSGHLPVEFEYDLEIVAKALHEHLGLDPSARHLNAAPQLPPRPPVLCPGCPHRASFHTAHRVFGKKTVYVNDIGCYTLGYGAPLDSCDVLLCMGSSITQASGISRTTKKRTVAYIGDSTFFHSGLPALANAVQADDDITVVILNNYVTAMTGFQPSVSAHIGTNSDDGSPADKGQSIENAVRGLGVKNVYAVDPFDEEAARAAFKSAKDDSGLSVVICNSPCAVEEARKSGRERNAPYAVDEENCSACTLCVRLLGCPAISVVDGKYSIDRELCDGCHLCADVCKFDAIKQVDA